MTTPVESWAEAVRQMELAVTDQNYGLAAILALKVADLISVRSPEGLIAYTQRAQVYATLHQTKVISSNYQDKMTREALRGKTRF